MRQWSTRYQMKALRRQRGAILAVSLIILLVMTLVGITGLQTTTLEERMAGNMRDRALAFESAESALRFAEDFIEANVVSLGAFDDDGSDGLYDDTVPQDQDKEIWEVVDWMDSGSSSNKAIAADKLDGVASAPRFVIQHYGSIQIDVDKTNLDNYGTGLGAGEVQMFQITARGTGGSDNAVVVLQATYGKLL